MRAIKRHKEGNIGRERKDQRGRQIDSVEKKKSENPSVCISSCCDKKKETKSLHSLSEPRER